MTILGYILFVLLCFAGIIIAFLSYENVPLISIFILLTIHQGILYKKNKL